MRTGQRAAEAGSTRTRRCRACEGPSQPHGMTSVGSMGRYVLDLVRHPCTKSPVQTHKVPQQIEEVSALTASSSRPSGASSTWHTPRRGAEPFPPPPSETAALAAASSRAIGVHLPAPSGANKKSFPRGAPMHHLAPRQNPERSKGHSTALDSDPYFAFSENTGRVVHRFSFSFMKHRTARLRAVRAVCCGVRPRTDLAEELSYRPTVPLYEPAA